LIPGFLLRIKWPGHEVNYSPSSVLRLRMSGTVPLLLHCVFIASKGETSPLPLDFYTET